MIKILSEKEISEKLIDESAFLLAARLHFLYHTKNFEYGDKLSQYILKFHSKDLSAHESLGK